MAVTAHFYDQFFVNLAAKVIDLTTDSLHIALTSNSYVPNQGTDEYWSTPQAYEITGTGYSAGGVALSSVTSSVANGVWTLNAANVSWTEATFTAYYAVIYDSTPGSASSAWPLIGYIDFGGAQSPSSGTFSITWSSGIGTITIS